MRVRERDRRPVGELVHEQPVTDEERRDHRAGGNAERLDEKRLHDEVDRDRAGEGFEVFPEPAAERLRGFLSPAPRGGDGAGWLLGWGLSALCHDVRIYTARVGSGVQFERAADSPTKRRGGMRSSERIPPLR